MDDDKDTEAEDEERIREKWELEAQTLDDEIIIPRDNMKSEQDKILEDKQR